MQSELVNKESRSKGSLAGVDLLKCNCGSSGYIGRMLKIIIIVLSSVRSWRQAGSGGDVALESVFVTAAK